MPQYPNLVIDADLSISGVGQLSNARIQNVTSAGRLTLQQELITSEAAGNTHTGQIIFDVDIQTLFIFVSANSQFEPVSFNQQGDVMFKGVINPTNANTNTTAGAESGSGSAGTDSDSGVDSGSTGSTTTTTTANWVVVGVPYDDDNGTDSGSVYVYDASNLSAQPTKLTAFDGAAGDNFGWSVAATADKIVVSAQYDDDNGTDSGSVYVYDASNLSAQPTKLTAFDGAEGDWSGWSVAATSDKIIVGSWRDDDNGTDSGSVYVYDANDLSATPTKLTAFDAAESDRFGISVATTDDKIVVGAYYDDDNGTSSGSVYVYDANNLSATPTKLTAFDGAAGDRFGSSVAASGDKIVVGANYDDSNSGSVYVFDANNLSATPTKLTAFDGAAGDNFGRTVDAFDDKIFVGAYGDDSYAGSVYVFDANDLSAQPTKLTAFDGAENDRFGNSVVATSDKIIVGAYYDDDNGSQSGSVYVFDANNLSATPTKLTAFDGAAGDNFGSSVAIGSTTTTTTTSSGSGDTGSTGSTTTTTTANWVVVGAYGDDDNGSNSGSVYVYDANDLSAQPTKLTAFDGAANDWLGISVAATNDKIIVGANLDDDNGENTGSVYVYDVNDLSAQPTKLTAFDSAAGDYFGWSVAATSDKIIVGAYYDEDNGFRSGSVYVFDANNLSAQPTKLTAFDGDADDRFGISVAATADKIVVSAVFDDDNFSNSGSVYVYDANDLSATPTKLTAFDGAESDRFSSSVAATNDKIIVAARGDDDNGSNSGSVYVFDANDLSAQPTKLTAFDGAEYDQFGISVAATNDKIIVGANLDDDNGEKTGSVYIYDANDLTAQPTKLTAFDAAAGDYFGSSVAATDDKIIVGASGDDDNGSSSGSAYVFDANDLSATPTKLTAFDGAANVGFATSLAIAFTTTTTTSSGSGDTGSTGSTTTTTTAKWVVVAAQHDDDNGTMSGSAYVYDANNLSATPTKLTAFDGAAYDYFGISVAAIDDKIVVGANYDDDKGDTSGSVYVYDANDLSAQPTKLTAFDGAEGDQFGWSVAATADKIVVGTWLDDDNGTSSGSVYVYDANDLTSQPTKLTAFDGAENDKFGHSVAATDDKIVVGVFGDDDDGSMSGSVYVFDANDLSATPTKLTAFDGAAGDRFGHSVAVAGDKIIVGAQYDDDNEFNSGSVYVYDANNLSATPTKLTAFDGAREDQFGHSVAASGDKVIVGADADDDNGSNSGSVYVFDANNLSAQPTKLTAFDGAADDRFGKSVAAVDDKIVVGAYGDNDNGTASGSVYVYDANDLSATPTKLTAFDGDVTDYFGYSVAIGSTTTTTTSSGSGAGTDSTSTGVVTEGALVDTSIGGIFSVPGFQYVVDTAGTLVRDGVTFYPNGQVEVGDIVLFTSATEAYVLQSNVSPATIDKAGTINLATQAAVDAGVIDSDAVTPATLAGSQLAAQVVLNTSAQNTNATDIASLQAFIGEGTALSSTATDLAAAINELVGRADSSATEIDGLEALVGEGTVLATAATSLAAGLNELVARQDSSDSELDAIFSDLNSLQAFTGQGTALDTTAADLAAAINELHGEIVTNASEVAANTSDIAPTTASILTNTSEIVANDSDLAALNTRLGEIDVDLSGVNDTITSLYTQIASNDADIATIFSTFGSNDSELASLVARMLTAEGNIIANDSEILALQSRITSVEGNTTANDSDISASAALISSLETYFGSDSLNTSAITLAGAINELHSDADANAAAILGNDSDILGLQTLLGYGSLDTTATTLAGAMNELQSGITANDSDIAVLTGQISTVESQDDVKAYNQDNITFVADVEQTIAHNLGLEIVTGFTIAVMDGTGDMIEATIRALDSNSIGIMTEFDVSNASMFMLANLSAPAAGDIPPGTVMTQSGGYVVTQGGVYVVLNGYTGGGTSTESGTDSSSPAPAPAPSIVTEGLVFYVDAGDTSSYSGSGTTWSDLVGSNDATLVNGVTHDNESMVFDGSNDYVTIPSSLTIGDTFTFSTWINADSLSGRRSIFSTRQPDSGSGLWQLEVGSGNNGINRVAISRPNQWVYNSSDNVISTNTWHHITIVKADATTNFEIFVDGVSQGLAPVSLGTSGNNNTRLVGVGEGSRYYFDGKMNSVVMYNRALNGTEIQFNYDASKDRYNEAPTISGIDASYTPATGSDTVITASATDPEGDAITWSYEVISGDLAGTTVAQSGNVFTVSHGLQDTNFTLRFKATDSAGNVTSHDATFASYTNQAPTISGVASAYTLTQGQDTVITASATDPEGDTATFSFEVPVTVSADDYTITGLYSNTLVEVSDGLSLTISNGNSWEAYQNLPTYLQGLLTTTTINDTESSTWTIPACTAYMVRANHWNTVPTTGWTLIESGKSYISGHNNVVDVYSKTFAAGSYEFNNDSAMYLFDGEIIAEQINVALDATSTASTHISDRPPSLAHDGIIGISDTDGSTISNVNAWVTTGEGVGAWMQLDWPTPQTVNKIKLYDRPNVTHDHIKGGTLTFSDGSSVTVGELPDGVVNGAPDPLEVTFDAKTITWVRFTVDAFTGHNAGLTEFEVFSLSASVDGTTVSQADNVFTITPGTESTDFDLSITATDSNNNASTVTSDISFTYINQHPVVSGISSAYTLVKDQDTVITGVATDPEGDAITWSYDIAGGISASDFTLTGMYNNNLATSANGLGLTIDPAGNGWNTYQNLPTYLTGLLCTTGINEGESLSFTIPACTVYMLRAPNWHGVDTTGWELIESGANYMTPISNLEVYSKEFSAGTYNFDNQSAMYMFAGETIDMTVSQTDNVFTITPGTTDISTQVTFTATDSAGNATSVSSDITFAAPAPEPAQTIAKWVVIGAHYDDDNGFNSGSVYVYDADDLSAQPTKLTAFDGAEVDYFGHSVAATADKIFVGAYSDDDNGTDSGSVYVYDANNLSAQPTKLTAFDAAAGDLFGMRTVATADKIFVTARGDDDKGDGSGSVYVYDANNLSAQPTKLTAFDSHVNSSSRGFGNKVVAIDDKIVIGAYLNDGNTYVGSSAGAVYVYDANDLSATPTKLTAFDGAGGDMFGVSMAAIDDKIVVGAFNDDDNGTSSGSVYVYDANDLSAQPTKLTAFDGAASDRFGISVAATADKIVIGAYQDDDGGSNVGSVYIYDANDLSATPTKLTAFDGAASDFFGRSVSATSDKIFVWASGDDDKGSNSGSVYVYDANDLSAQLTKLTAFDGAATDNFGISVAIASAPAPAPAPAPSIVTEGLVFYVDAGDTSSYSGSGTTWSDLSGNGVNGTLVNGPTYSSDDGGKIVFDNSNDYVNFSSPSVAFGDGDFAIEIWVKFTSAPDQFDQIMQGRNPDATGVFWGYRQGNLDFVNNNDSYPLLRKTWPTQNEWTHLVLTRDASKTVSLYRNGILDDGTIYNAMSFDQTEISIGSSFGYNVGREVGLARLYVNKGLSADEVVLNYNDAKSRFGY